MVLNTVTRPSCSPAYKSLFSRSSSRDQMWFLTIISLDPRVIISLIPFILFLAIFHLFMSSF